MCIITEFFVAFWVMVVYTTYLKWRTKRPTVVRCLVGKTALVTGGNAGIGYETCLHLAARGCRVILASRSDSENSRRKIVEQTGNPNVISKQFNLASFESVRILARDLNESEEKIDILVLNAGIAGTKEDFTENGINPVMQVNYFSHFLLTQLLSGLLKKSRSSRILFVSSLLAHLENLTTENINVNSSKAYYNSKLADIIAADFFAEKLKSSGVSSNSFHPGMVDTNLQESVKHNKDILQRSFSKIAKAYFWLCGTKVSSSAEHILSLCSSPEFEDVSAKFFCGNRVICKPWKAQDDEFVQKFLKLTENLIALPGKF